MRLSVILAAFAVGCEGPTYDTFVPEEVALVETDQTCPGISHDPIETSQLFGQDVSIEAWLDDEDSGVFVAEVTFKSETSTEWRTRSLVDIGEGQWVASIPGSEVRSGGMDYYLTAVDQADNACNYPEDGPDDPFHFRITAD